MPAQDQAQRASASVGYVALLRRNRDFRQLWLGQVVSQLGDWFDTIAVYTLVAIVKKRLAIQASLHTMLQILSLALFDKQPLEQLLRQAPPSVEAPDAINQLNLFGF